MKPLKSNLFITTLLILISSTPLNSQLNKETIEIVELPNAGLYKQGAFTMKINIQSVDLMRFSFFVFPFKNVMFGLNTSFANFSDYKFSYLIPSVYGKVRVVEEKLNSPALSLGISTHAFATNEYVFEVFAPSLFLVSSKSFRNFLGICNFNIGFVYSFGVNSASNTSQIYFGSSQMILRSIWINLEYYKKFGGEKRLQDNLLNFSAEWVVATNVKIGIVIKDLLKNSNKGLIKKFLKIELGLK